MHTDDIDCIVCKMGRESKVWTSAITEGLPGRGMEEL
jgi:hypothetical protein